MKPLAIQQSLCTSPRRTVNILQLKPVIGYKWFHFSALPTRYMEGTIMIRFTLKWLAILLVAFIIASWFSTGQDNIIEGPPETPGVSYAP